MSAALDLAPDVTWEDPFGLTEFPYRYERLSRRCAAFVNADGLSSVGVIEADEGLVIVDATIHPFYITRILAEIAATYARPILHLVNTHFHLDHTIGNAYVPAERGILAHRLCADYQRRFLPRMVSERDASYASIQVAPPHLTFEGDHHVIEQCSLEVVIHQTGGHTHDSCVVHVPEEGVVLAGDSVFNRVPPYIAHWSCVDHFGRVSEWIDSLSLIERLAPRIILPGHGEIATRDDIDGLRRFFEYYTEIVKDGVRRGVRLKEIWRSILERDDFQRRELEADIYLHLTMALHDELTGDGALYEK